MSLLQPNLLILQLFTICCFNKCIRVKIRKTLLGNIKSENNRKGLEVPKNLEVSYTFMLKGPKCYGSMWLCAMLYRTFWWCFWLEYNIIRQLQRLINCDGHVEYVSQRLLWSGEQNVLWKFRIHRFMLKGDNKW